MTTTLAASVFERLGDELWLLVPAFGFALLNSQDDHMLSANNLHEPPSGTFAPGDEVVFSIRFPNHLAPDRYWVTPSVATSTGNDPFLNPASAAVRCGCDRLP